MPPLSQSDARKRLQLLSHALRAFGLVDRYGLADFLFGKKPPSRSNLATFLKARRVVLPPSINYVFVADTILSEVFDTSGPSYPVAKTVERLLKIPTGGQHASAYHKGVFTVLKLIFQPQLLDGRIEQQVNSGRKRIDIVFRNSASDGFFSDLATKHQIFCPYLSFECKNYSREIKNPEFDQLIARFDDRWGRFGILVCRVIKNNKRALLACKDAMAANTKAGGGLMFLEDADLRSLATLADADNQHGIDDFLRQRYQAILMS